MPAVLLLVGNTDANCTCNYLQPQLHLPSLPSELLLNVCCCYSCWLLHLLCSQAQIWQLDFALSPEALRELNTQMRIDEDVLRYVVVKRSLPKLPTPRQLYHRLSEHADILRPPRHPN